MGVFDIHITLGRLANMGNDIEGFDVVLFDTIGDRRNITRFVVAKNAYAFAFKKVIPKPSEWVLVKPARWRKPSKEKTISVGTLQFIPNNWHMIFLPDIYNLRFSDDLTR